MSGEQLGTSPVLGLVLAQPDELGVREHGADRVAGDGVDLLARDLGEDLLDVGFAAQVLPTDEGPNQLPAAVEQADHRSLARERHRGDVLRVDARLLNRRLAGGEQRRGDVLGDLLHPPGLGVVARVLAVVRPDNCTLEVEDARLATGRALVDAHQISRHGFSSLVGTAQIRKAVWPPGGSRTGPRAWRRSAYRSAQRPCRASTASPPG